MGIRSSRVKISKMFTIMLMLSLTVFFINADKAYSATLEPVELEKTFEYTGNIQEYVVPATGIYKLEVWGAQGGNTSDSNVNATGGKGGYSYGNIKLIKDQKLYIGVGQAGVSNTTKTSYNGGGKGSTALKSMSSGGGATHIAIDNNRGELKNYSSNRDDIIIVGGGGGGARSAIASSSNYWSLNGGAGGGLSGDAGMCVEKGKITPSTSGVGTQDSGYQFGLGSSSNGSSQSGAGGGWYGGNVQYNCAGNGGSGHLSESLIEDTTGMTNGVRSGNGLAKISIVGDPSDATLSNLTVTGNYTDETLISSSSDTKRVFNVNLNPYEVEVNIDLERSSLATSVTYEDFLKIPSGESSTEIIATSYDGNVEIYTINFYRTKNDIDYIRSLTVNGEEVANFDKDTLEYNIELSPFDETENLEIGAVLNSDEQEIVGLGTYKIGYGTKSYSVTVTSEDKTKVRTYTINVTKPHTTRLKIVELDGISLSPIFDKDTFEYNINIGSLDHSVKILRMIPYDSGATVKAVGHTFIPVDSNGLIKITVTEPNSATSVYIINAKRDGLLDNGKWGYGCSNDIITFVAPETRYYKLEAWGAQGGKNGGRGGYTTGKVKLLEGQELYVGVGCQGGTGTSAGYNGGGNGTPSSWGGVGGAGGGATHFAVNTNRGELKNYSDARSDVVIVAGGGGGGNNDGRYAGGGGGTNGISGELNYSGTGGTQTAGGIGKGWLITGSPGTFGKGGNASTNSVFIPLPILPIVLPRYAAGGGGGGWYGGAGGDTQALFGTPGAGGGGSSYITTARKVKNKNTIAGNASMPTYQGGYTTGKTGDGFATITAAEYPSTNNNLKKLTITATDEITKEETKKSYTPTLDSLVTDYYVHLESNETLVELDGEVDDEDAVITSGLGTYEIEGTSKTVTITVLADSGDTKEYNIHFTRELDTNAKLLDIQIVGLIPSYCNLNEGFCKLDPEQFYPNVDSYEMTVPGIIDTLKFVVKKAHKNQTVTGDGPVFLSSSENNITITVTAEDGVTTMEYHYKINKDFDSNPFIGEIKVLDPDDVDLNYSRNVFNYYISVPNEYDKYIDVGEDEKDTSLSNTLQLYIKPESLTASYTLDGDGTLKPGNNLITVTSTSKSGEILIYNINVYRSKDNSTLLSNLQVFNGADEIEIKPEFNKFKYTYHATVDNDVSTVNIVATPEDSNSNVIGDGEKTLVSGQNKFDITITNIDGDTESYSLTIVKEKDSNAYLKSLVVKDNSKEYSYTPEFDKDTFEYTVYVDSNVNKLDIIGTPEVSTSTVINLKDAIIKEGINKKTIYVYSENGSVKSYNVNIIKTSSIKNALLSLRVYDDNGVDYEYTPEFNPETFEYYVEVDNSVKFVNVKGTKEDPTATLTGNGKYALSPGVNFAILTLTKPDEEPITYTVAITRKKDTNAYLKSITTSVGKLTPTFDKENLSYTINVDNDVESIRIDSEPELISTSVTGNGLYNLSTGNNTIELVTLAQDEETSLTYTINVVRKQSDNANIAYLILKEGALSPDFDPDIVNYSASVPYEVTSGTFIVELEDKNSTYEILNNENFEIGENLVTIRVTSQSGEIKDYKVNITRQNESTTNYLETLKVSKGELVPAFDKHNQFYEVEVENEISELTISATPEYATSTVDGTGLKKLSKGRNLFVIRVTDKNGKIRDYQVLVTRKGNNEARLKSLSLNDGILTPAFDKDTYEYSTSTANESLVFKEVVPLDKNATYEIKNNSFTTVGVHTVTITVTAEDEETTKDYTILVNKTPSDNNNLMYLEVEGYDIVPTFDRNITVYTLTVEDDINIVNIIAKAEDENATVTGTGLTNVQVGENVKFVKVTSQSGKTKAYTITITKQGSDNNRLTLLDVRNGTITPEYSNDINDYNVEIPYEETYADLYYILEDESATVNVTGNSDLEVGNNNVTMTVTAANGDVRIINLNVNRKAPVSSLLKTLKVNGYSLTPEFNSYLMNYDLVVNNETEELDMIIETLDPNATYVVMGNSLELGLNQVTIEVTSSNNVDKSTYTINVDRQEYTNNYLLYIYTNHGRLSPTFNKDVLEYTVNVDYDIESIEVYAMAENSLATISSPNPKINTTDIDGLVGEFALETGENRIAVDVISEDAVKRTYYLNVIREKNDDNYLKSLKVKHEGKVFELVPEFDKEETSYFVSVPSDIENVEITATAHNDRATITGTGEFNINFGDNTFNITVKAENGNEKVYTVVVNKALSTNNNLFLLEPSVGEFEPDFDSDTLEYYLELGPEDATLSFAYIAEDKYAIVTGVDEQLVPDGESVREVVVTAENGDTKTYVINVNKVNNSNAYLNDLYVIDYPFIDENGDEVTFDKDVYDYYITVPYSKGLLAESEVVAELSDSKAKIEKDSTMQLLSTQDNIYKVKVTARDGFTTSYYNIHINREKNNNALLKSLKVNEGRLNESFYPTTFNYEWTILEEIEIGESLVEYEPEDENATVTAVLTDNTYEITVTSEDESVTNTYVLTINRTSVEEALLKSLSVDKGIIEPVFDPNTKNYDIYEYEDTETITLSAEPEDETATVTGTGEISLDRDFIKREIKVVTPEGKEGIYTVNIHRVISKYAFLEDLGLNGLDGLNCVDNLCTLNPEFVPNETNYEIKVPYEYDKLDVYYRLNNEHQTVDITVDGNEYAKGMDLEIGETEVTVKVYDGLKELTSTYTMTVIRLENVTITTPDGPIVYPKGEDYELPTNDISKDSDTYDVTFKYHDDATDDLVRQVTKSYIANGWLVNGVHYDDNESFEVLVDTVIEPDYIETIIPVEFPTEPSREHYTFDGWYTEETGGEKVESYSEKAEITLHAHWIGENQTVITPDKEEEVPYGSEYELGTNDISKTNETYTVTFKYHDDVTGDLERIVTVQFTPNGWLVNGVHYDDETSFKVISDTLVKPDYIETVIGAEFPSDPTRDNYEFIGWFDAEEDGTKYTEYNEKADITLHARWEATLPTDITIDSEDITLIVGETHQIEVTFIPEGTSDVVTYTNFDSEIISVTEEGLVTGLSKGTTTINIGTENTDIEKTITVTVLSDKLESDSYRVLDKVRPKENEEDPDITDRIIIGADAGVTISEFKENMLNPKENLKVYDKDEVLIESDEEIIRTGLIIKLEYNGIVYDTATIIVKGDINEDGFIDVIDEAILTDHILTIDLINDYRFYAADIEEDNFIDVIDDSKLTDYILRILDTLN